MVSLWGRCLYFNQELIQLSDNKMMNAVFGLSVYIRSRIRSTFIGHNTYTGRSSNLRSKPTPIRLPVHK